MRDMMDKDKELINSIINAVDILDILKLSNKELGATEIAEKLGINKSSTYRILRTLAYTGMISKNSDTNKYKLGVKTVDLASGIVNSYDYKDTIFKYMKMLKEEVAETTVLSVYTDLIGVCIEQIEVENTIKYSSKIGYATPLHSGAAGKILLAYQSDEIVDKVIENGLKKYTENTIISGNQLKKEIENIRNSGYAISYAETDIGVMSIAVPIFYKDNLLYGLSIVGSMDRMKDKGIQWLIDKVVKSGNEVNKEIKNNLF